MPTQKYFLFLPVLVSALIVASGAVDKIHFLRNQISSADGIVIESDGHFGLIDTLNPGANTAFNRSDMLQFVVFCDDGTCNLRDCDSGAYVKRYLDSLAKQNPHFKKLDFVLITHSHSDHIGGFSEMMDYIDADTTVFYKEPSTDETFWENVAWKNHEYFKETIELMNAKFGNQWNGCDVNQSSKCKGVNTGRLDTKNINEKMRDYIYFDFGNLHINLYNLHHISEDVENDNTIVMFITKDDGARVALMGDIEARAGLEQQIANIIGAPVDIFKAGHHGYCHTSDSQYTLDFLKPKAYIITGNREFQDGTYHPKMDNQGAILHLMEQSYGTKIYLTHQSEGAIVAELTTNNQSHFEIRSRNISTGLEFNLDPIDRTSLRNGWAPFIVGETDPYYTWHYINDGEFNKTIPGWNEIQGGWYYLLDGGKVQTGWFQIDDNWYLFDGTGVMLTGWQLVGGVWYYLDANGTMATNAWREDAKGRLYYLSSDGSMATGWNLLNNVWYYLGDDGAMVADDWHQESNGTTYYFSSNGMMVTESWVHPKDNKWYYVDDKGAMVSNTSRTIDGQEYKFDPHGVCQMTAGWHELKEDWYFFDSDGTMAASDWRQDESSGKWYYFISNGAMATNSLIHSKNRKWYYVDDKGVMVTNTSVTINGTDYQFSTSGECQMSAGWQNVNGTWYYFDDAEKTAAEAWRQDSNKRWFYLGSDGTMVTGIQKINTTWYFFDDDGGMVSEDWRQTSDGWYYLGLNGDMAIGWKEVKDAWYFFGDDGIMYASAWYLDNMKEWHYFSSSGAMVTSNWVHSAGTKWYYVDEYGIMVSDTSRTIDGTEYVFDQHGVCSIKTSTGSSSSIDSSIGSSTSTSSQSSSGIRTVSDVLCVVVALLVMSHQW